MQTIELSEKHKIIIPDGAQLNNFRQEQVTQITRLALRNRFTFVEKVAIETAAETDATVRVLLKDQEAATFIDLARPDTHQGVQLLVSKNLITPQRAAEILSLTIQPEEIFRG